MAGDEVLLPAASLTIHFLFLPQICSALPSIVPMLPRLCHIDKGSQGLVEGTIRIPLILNPLPRGEGNINGD